MVSIIAIIIMITSGHSYIHGGAFFYLYRGRGGTTGQLCELKLPQQRDIIARAPGRGRGRGAALQEEGYTMEETVPCRLTSTGLEELKRKAGINTSFNSGLNQMQTQFNNMNHSKFKTKDFPALNK